jgi:hypothetical protein
MTTLRAMDERARRRLRIYVVIAVLLAPAAFALPYLLPDGASRFERGMASAALVVVAEISTFLLAWVLDRRRTH